MTRQLVFTNNGLIQGARQQGVLRWLCLYQNDVPLAKGFDPTLLIEADFSNYARVELDSGLWTGTPVIDSDGNASIYYPQQTFLKSGATSNAAIFGYFYVYADGVKILFAQAFDGGPYPMVLDGDFLRITPRYSTSTPIFP